MVEHRSPKPGVGSSSLSSRANIIEMKKVIAYIKAYYDELVHKVSWPTYSELANSAVVVLYASLLIALVVWGMDAVSYTHLDVYKRQFKYSFTSFVTFSGEMK